MRLLTFLLVFLGVAFLVVGSIFWINRDAFIAVFQNRTALLEGSEWVEKTYSLGGLIEFMAEQPQHAMLLSIPFSAGIDGNKDPESTMNIPAGFEVPDNRYIPSDQDGSEGPDDEPVVRYKSDRMYPAGTLSNLLLLITYADLVTSDALDPDTSADTDVIAAFHIPGLDRSHIRNFRQWIYGLDEPPTTGELVRYLVVHDDPAIADYLFFHLGADEVARRVAMLGDGLIEAPVPQFGIRMKALEHPENITQSEHLAVLSQQERSVFLEDAVAAARRQWVQPRERPETAIPSFTDQRALHRLYPQIQPERFAGLLKSIWQGTLISEEVSSLLRDLLEREPDDRLLAPHVTHYAAHFDERMGYMNGWSLGGKTKQDLFRVQIILAVDIPAGLWFHMNSNFMVRDFHNRMLYDPVIRNRTCELLCSAESQAAQVQHKGPE